VPDHSLDDESIALSMALLTESLNLGLGQVINQLAEIFGSEIELNVPAARLASRDDLNCLTEKLFKNDSILVIKQVFDGGLSGTAMMFFPENEEQHLLGEFLAENEQLNLTKANLAQLKMLQMARVAVTGIVDALSSMLKLDIQTQDPVCSYVPVDQLMNQLSEDRGNLLFLTISFNAVSSNTHAQLLICKSPDTLSKISQVVRQQMGL
jgi:chemotaxis protein CheY-P-specific phosphatase CheC